MHAVQANNAMIQAPATPHCCDDCLAITPHQIVVVHRIAVDCVLRWAWALPHYRQAPLLCRV